jgi:hypothetical protein
MDDIGICVFVPRFIYDRSEIDVGLSAHEITETRTAAMLNRVTKQHPTRTSQSCLSESFVVANVVVIIQCRFLLAKILENSHHLRLADWSQTNTRFSGDPEDQNTQR